MKKIIYGLTLVVFTMLAGCEKFTDIQPKGKNLLSSVNDLNMLLNEMYSDFYSPRATTLTSVVYFTDIGILANEPIKTFNHALLFWDETIDRAALRPTCNVYEPIYRLIGRTFNPVIAKADGASGDRKLANRYKAEALVLRAWFHYLSANYFAKAYNPATASTDGGVPYLLETDLISQPIKKYTVAETYDLMLKDLDAAFKLDALPNEGVNKQRVGKAFAYAVQARVLLSMRRYEEALVAARASLAINNHIDDHNQMLIDYPLAVGSPTPKIWSRPAFSSREDLFNVPSSPTFCWHAPEVLDIFETNSVLQNYMPTQGKISLPYDLGDYFGMPGVLGVWDLRATSEISAAGLTSVDMRLVEAECLLHLDEVSDAKDKLEEIREKRIITDLYAPSTASAKQQVFKLLKQLYRSENWCTLKDLIDLKRWNTYPEYAENLYRTILGTTYTLTPESKLWIWPFPQSATNLNPGLTQNY